MPPDLVVRISLVRDEASLAELHPSVWRRFKVSSAVNLELLHDKVLAPLMGWERNYHTYYFRKVHPSAPTVFVQEDTQAADLMHAHGYIEGTFAKPEYETIGGLLEEVGDKCLYNYDLGDNFYHCLELEKIVPADEADGRVEVIDGAMRCPDEDGDGSAAYQEAVLDLLVKCKAKPNDDDLARKLAKACFERRNGLNVRGSFRPEEFDLEERKAAVIKALGSRNSTRDTTKMFSTGGFSFARIGQQHVVYKKEDDRFDHMGGFVDMHETVAVKPDPKECTLCYHCGSWRRSPPCLRHCPHATTF